MIFFGCVRVDVTLFCRFFRCKQLSVDGYTIYKNSMRTLHNSNDFSSLVRVRVIQSLLLQLQYYSLIGGAHFFASISKSHLKSLLILSFSKSNIKRLNYYYDYHRPIFQTDYNHLNITNYVRKILITVWIFHRLSFGINSYRILVLQNPILQL